LLVPPAGLFAAPIVIDFDTLGDLDAVTTQFPGLRFPTPRCSHPVYYSTNSNFLVHTFNRKTKEI